MAGYELRVHGIGSHNALSSLGDAVLVAGETQLGIYEAPPAPAHRVRMLSWTPAARSTFSPLWWVALPFTLINLAGHMRPPKRSVYSIAHSISVGATGLLLTAGYFLWGVALGELVLSRIADLSGDRFAANGIVVVVGLVIIITIIVRTHRHIHGRGPRIWAYAHVILILGLSIWLISKRPAVMVSQTWFNICVSETGKCGPHPNALAALNVGAIYTAVALAGFCIALDLFASRFSADPAVRGVGHPGLVGTAALIVTSVFLLITIGSLFNIALDALMRYLDTVTSFPAFDQATGLQDKDKVLTPWEPKTVLRFVDLIPWFTIAALLGLLIVVWAALPRARWGDPRRDIVERYAAADESANVDQKFVTAVARAESVHRIVTDLRKYLPVALIEAGAFAAIGTIMLIFLLGYNSDAAHSLLLMTDHALALGVMVGFLAIFVFPGARSLLGFIDDIAGYWPIVWHPLAGAPYAKHVVQELKEEISNRNGEPVVLVGHSQGSVICFDMVKQLCRDSADLSGVSLVTCGSPLATLYATFFPAYFPRSAFATVCGSVTWVNVWRGTDPIASPMPDACGVTDIEVLDEPKATSLRRHSGYWTHEAQAAQVHRLLSY